MKECNNGKGHGKEHIIEKWDCTSHVTKRLVTGLRNLRRHLYRSQQKWRSLLGGKNKLTGKIIDQLQHYFKHLMAAKQKLNFTTAVVTMEYNNGYVASILCGSLSLPYSTILDEALKKKGKRMNKPLVKRMRNKCLQRELVFSPGNF